MKRTPFVHIAMLIVFTINLLGPCPTAQAQEFKLPVPGVMVHLSPPFDPPVLTGIKVHPENPFQLDFILDIGDRELSQEQLRDESLKLTKYFLASLTIPEKDLWVNLSPYEKNRIVPNSFGLTEMGRDLLAEDYMLKQITASLMYPQEETGKKFWKRVYEEAAKRYGTSNVPINTFNKVWIVPEKAVVYENLQAGTAYLVESKLKVMLEEDYLSLSHHVILNRAKDVNNLGSQIVRDIVIPELTREINDNKNFSHLRQVYNSLILATWYKNKIKDSILSQVYLDKNKTAGITIADPQEKEKIYARYLQAFKKGVYNYIKEEEDPVTNQLTPRKYFSGGFNLGMTALGLNGRKVFQTTTNSAMLNNTAGRKLVKVAISIAVAAEAVLAPLSTEAVNGTAQVYTPNALSVLAQINHLKPAEVRAITKQALETVGHNIKASGHGVIGLNRMMNDMNIPGATLDDKITTYAVNMEEALKHSPHFLDHLKNSPNPFLAFNLEIDSIIGVEAMFNNKATNLRKDGRRDEGFLQTSGFRHPSEYYHTHPMEYLLEVIQDHWDVTMGVAQRRAQEITDVYGSSFLDYFKWVDRERLEFMYARVLWNGGTGLHLNVLARVPIAVNVMEGRLTFMTTKAAEAMSFAYGGSLETVTPNLNADRWGHINERMTFDDELLNLFKELNTIHKLQLPEAERVKRFNAKKQEIDQKIQAFRQKYSLISYINTVNPSVDGLASSHLTISYAYSGAILNGITYATNLAIDAAQVAQGLYDSVVVALPKNRSLAQKFDRQRQAVHDLFVAKGLSPDVIDKAVQLLPYSLTQDQSKVLFARIHQALTALPIDKVTDIMKASVKVQKPFLVGHNFYDSYGDLLRKDVLRKIGSKVKQIIGSFKEGGEGFDWNTFNFYDSGKSLWTDRLDGLEGRKLRYHVAFEIAGTVLPRQSFDQLSRLVKQWRARHFPKIQDQTLLDGYVMDLLLAIYHIDAVDRSLSMVIVKNPWCIRRVLVNLPRSYWEIKGRQVKNTRTSSESPAMKAAPDNGGIDFTAGNINLKTTMVGGKILFHVDPAMLSKLQHAPGFVPRVITIQPLKDLPQFLGLNQK